VMSTRPFYILTLAAAVACASARAPSTGTHRDANLITEQEIVDSRGSNGFDVVSRLRPMFLKTRGTSTINARRSEYASVFVDGAFYGNLSSLRTIVANQIHEIRYLSGIESASKYGFRYGSGAIDVRTK
jgi:hypothetical protein